MTDIRQSDSLRATVALDANELGALALQLERDARVFTQDGDREAVKKMHRRADELRALAAGLRRVVWQ